MRESNGIWFPDNDEHMRLQHLRGKTQMDMLQLGLTFLTKTRTVVNAGAHVGLWALEYAKLFDRVMAFEMCPDTFDCLIMNTKGHENIETYCIGLSNYTGKAGFGIDTKNAANTGGNYLVNGGDGCTIKPLDSFDISDLDLLSLDAEGSEPQILQGAVETIRQCSPVIVCEEKSRLLIRQGNAPDSVHKFLKSLGYVRAAQVRCDYVYVKGTK